MKILQLINSTERRGGECFAVALADELAAAGNSVEVLSLAGAATSNTVASGHVSISVLPDASPRIRRLMLGVVEVMRRARQTHGTLVVQANIGDTLYVAVAAKLLGVFARRKLVVVYRHASLTSYWLAGRWWSRKTLGCALRLSDAIATISAQTERDLLTLYPRLRGRTKVVPNGVDPERFQQRERPTTADAPVLLHVGAFTDEKNQIALVRVLEAIHENGIRAVLRLVGDGPLMAEVKSAVAPARLDHYVDLVGASTQIPELMASADLLVLPSKVEGVPGVVIEAMFAGLPVVAFDVGSVGEMLDNDRGIAVPAGDHSRFADAVIELLNDPGRGQEFAAHAFEHARQAYALRKVSQQFLDLYRVLRR